MNKQQLASKIWASANKMRSKIEANEYKDYILGSMLNADFSEYQKNLSESKSVNNDSLATVKIFDTLKSISQNHLSK